MWTQKITILCDWLNFSTFSPYDKVHIWSQYVRVSLSTVQSVYRVCIVHEIVGVGGLFEWGGLARELRTLMEGLVVLALATHVGGLWKLDMRGATVCKIHILLHCSAALKSWAWAPAKYPDLTDKNFPVLVTQKVRIESIAKYSIRRCNGESLQEYGWPAWESKQVLGY